MVIEGGVSMARRGVCLSTSILLMVRVGVGNFFLGCTSGRMIFLPIY